MLSRVLNPKRHPSLLVRHQAWPCGRLSLGREYLFQHLLQPPSLTQLGFEYNSMVLPDTRRNPARLITAISVVPGFTSCVGMEILLRLLMLLAFLSTTPVSCAGTAFISNTCDFDVYISSVANTTNNTWVHLAPEVGQFAEEYRQNPNGGGISLKIGAVPNTANITQFEYTDNITLETISYDLSNIDGYPFVEGGLYLVPSNAECGALYCPPGIQLCPNAFNHPWETQVQRACNDSTNLTLFLCP